LGNHIRCSSTVTCGASAANRLIRWGGEHRGGGRGDAQPHGACLAAGDAAHGGLGGGDLVENDVRAGEQLGGGPLDQLVYARPGRG